MLVPLKGPKESSTVSTGFSSRSQLPQRGGTAHCHEEAVQNSWCVTAPGASWAPQRNRYSPLLPPNPCLRAWRPTVCSCLHKERRQLGHSSRDSTFQVHSSLGTCHHLLHRCCRHTRWLHAISLGDTSCSRNHHGSHGAELPIPEMSWPSSPGHSPKRHQVQEGIYNSQRRSHSR